MKRRSIILVLFGALLFALVLGVYYIRSLPKESSLLEVFYSHRESFEKMRDMLKGDEDALSVGKRGISTRNGTFKPPFGNISIERYDKYLALLRDVHAIEVSRWGRDLSQQRLAVVMWASGFAGDTTHIGVCWTTDTPFRQVPSLDAFCRDPSISKGEGWVYQHIDSHWYLWTDRHTQR